MSQERTREEAVIKEIKARKKENKNKDRQKRGEDGRGLQQAQAKMFKKRRE